MFTKKRVVHKEGSLSQAGFGARRVSCQAHLEKSSLKLGILGFPKGSRDSRLGSFGLALKVNREGDVAEHHNIHYLHCHVFTALQ